MRYCKLSSSLSQMNRLERKAYLERALERRFEGKSKCNPAYACG